MIDEKSFRPEWINSFKLKSEYSHIQTNILEKMIHSLYLVQMLKKNGLDFVFKGGTSLILVLDEDNRFSIDVDIICREKKETLKDIFDKVIQNSRFISYSLDEKRSYKPGVPKAHYIFKYISVINPDLDSSILLDILDEDIVYPGIKECPVKVKWLRASEQVFIKIPTVDSITGDKLTAYAPNTIGIPYFKGKISFGLEITKQLFDLGKLLDKVTDIKKVSESFYSFARKEIEYRKQISADSELTPEKVLNDIIQTCRVIAKRDANKTEPDKTHFRLLQEGIKSFGSAYMIKGKFRLEDAIISSSKAVYAAAIILTNNLSSYEIYSGENISDLFISDPEWNFLNKLKKLQDKSAFYYWYKATKLLDQDRTII
jgi:hypothetical protein